MNEESIISLDGKIMTAYDTTHNLHSVKKETDGYEEMDERTENMFNEVFTRLRETEAQTREQNILLKSQNDRIESLTKITDKFLEHLGKREARDEQRELNFWKSISVLIGAIVVLALGPKVAKEFFTKTPDPSVVAVDPWAVIHDRKYLDMMPAREEDPVA